MSRNRSNLLAAGAGVAVVACVALGGSAGAAYASDLSASVSLSASSVAVGTDPVLHYDVSDAPSGSNIYLEQSTNGGQAWQPVQQLTTGRGSVDLQPDTAGTYNFEIVVQQGGTVIISSAPTTLTVNNNSSQSSDDWLNDVLSFLGSILSGPVETVAGWFGF
jgi:hypothetical protein